MIAANLNDASQWVLQVEMVDIHGYIVAFLCTPSIQYNEIGVKNLQTSRSYTLVSTKVKFTITAVFFFFFFFRCRFLCSYYSRAAFRHLFLWRPADINDGRPLIRYVRAIQWWLLDAVSSKHSLSVLLSSVERSRTRRSVPLALARWPSTRRQKLFAYVNVRVRSVPRIVAAGTIAGIGHWLGSQALRFFERLGTWLRLLFEGGVLNSWLCGYYSRAATARGTWKYHWQSSAFCSCTFSLAHFAAMWYKARSG